MWTVPKPELRISSRGKRGNHSAGETIRRWCSGAAASDAPLIAIHSGCACHQRKLRLPLVSTKRAPDLPEPNGQVQVAAVVFEPFGSE